MARLLSKWAAPCTGSSATPCTAETPWGPWSAPIPWLDCRAFVGDLYPYCYSGQLHPVLARDGEAVVYLTFSSQEPYDLALLELYPGIPIHGWRDNAGNLQYSSSSPGEGYADTGIAFYALDRPAPGLVPVYEQPSASGYVYALRPADQDDQPAFYVHPASPPGLLSVKPVYRWYRDGREALDPHPRQGWTQGAVAFHAGVHPYRPRFTQSP